MDHVSDDIIQSFMWLFHFYRWKYLNYVIEDFFLMPFYLVTCHINILRKSRHTKTIWLNFFTRNWIVENKRLTWNKKIQLTKWRSDEMANRIIKQAKRRKKLLIQYGKTQSFSHFLSVYFAFVFKIDMGFWPPSARVFIHKMRFLTLFFAFFFKMINA